jgi:hypothetical protein
VLPLPDWATVLWSGGHGSNVGALAYQTSALPSELPPDVYSAPLPEPTGMSVLLETIHAQGGNIKSSVHLAGIGPATPTWQAGSLPLAYRCMADSAGFEPAGLAPSCFQDKLLKPDSDNYPFKWSRSQGLNLNQRGHNPPFYRLNYSLMVDSGRFGLPISLLAKEE